MRKMNLYTVATGASLLLAAMFTMNSQAGILDPKLEAAIEGMSPGDPVDVIIRCLDPLDLASVDTKNLVPALQNKASACETSLGNALKNTAIEPPVPLWIINGIAATVPVASLNGLVHRAGVNVVYLNETVELPSAPVPAGIPSNPPFTYWNISEIRATDLWEFGYYGTGVVVATMDTGVDANHADIGPKWRGGNNSWYDPNGQHATPFDASGHGTGVIGLIVGGNAGGFDIGVAPDAQWISVKIFDDQGQSDLAKIHQGFQWLLDPDGDQSADDAPDIVNSSWVLQGTEGECLGEFSADIAALKTAGVAVVFSAGNSGSGSGTGMDPANDPGSLSVGATDSAQRVLSSSSRGPSACDGGIYPKIAAPGKDVLTAGLTTNGANPTNYAFSTGTSFAAPHVAGAMAVLKSAFPGATMAEIESAISDGAIDLDTAGPDNNSGAGLIDLVGAYTQLSKSNPPPTDTDQDGVPDYMDNCPLVANGNQLDTDNDVIGDVCDTDVDGDGVANTIDNCPAIANTDQSDIDSDSIGDLCDDDADGDGLSNTAEDLNGNGVWDVGTETNPLNADTDGDSYSDGEEVAVGTDPLDPNSLPVVVVASGDINNDGVVNILDLLLGQQILLGLKTATPEQIARGDVAPLAGGIPSPDGLFNVGDLVVIQRKALDIIVF